MSFLFPHSTDFYDLFERSAAKAVEGAQLLEALVKAFNDVSLKAKRIKDVEHEGDLITHETIEKLNKTFVTPLDREDIHRLISSLDDILDFIEAASRFGIPLSTTHTISTAIMGVGASRRFSAVRWGIVAEIVTAWILTFPVCALIGWVVATALRSLS